MKALLVELPSLAPRFFISFFAGTRNILQDSLGQIKMFCTSVRLNQSLFHPMVPGDAQPGVPSSYKARPYNANLLGHHLLTQYLWDFIVLNRKISRWNSSRPCCRGETW